MEDEKRKTTAPVPSVGADGEQPIFNYTTGIITAEPDEINYPDEISEENFEEIQRKLDRISNPANLHTMTMNELYETAYPSRPPIIDGLLYPGTYLLAGAPKVGKSFLVEMISGTTGLLGCADGAFLLQKERGTSMTGTLDIVGRDQGEQKLFLIRDREHLFWNLDHVEAEVCEIPPDPILEKINTMLDAEWAGSSTELVQLLNLNHKPNAFTRYLNVNKGRLENEYGIDYQSIRTHAGRIVILKRIQPSP